MAVGIAKAFTWWVACIGSGARWPSSVCGVAWGDIVKGNFSRALEAVNAWWARIRGVGTSGPTADYAGLVSPGGKIASRRSVGWTLSVAFRSAAVAHDDECQRQSDREREGEQA